MVANKKKFKKNGQELSEKQTEMCVGQYSRDFDIVVTYDLTRDFGEDCRSP